MAAERKGNERMSQQFIDCGDGTYKMRTCAWSPPGDHPVGCGMYLKVKDGRIVGVEGDPEHPISQGRLCTRCLSLPEYVYSDKRVTTPLRRAREDRGFDKWEPITWDEAMDLIEENVRRIQKDYGNEAVAVFQGTGHALCTGDRLCCAADAQRRLHACGRIVLRPALRRGELHSGGRLSRARLRGVLL